MPSKRQKKAGFLLPDPVLGYPLLDVCLKIPNAPEYRQAFLGHLNKLGLWAIWEKSYLPGDTRARDAAELWRETLNQYLDMGCDDMNCCCDDPPAQFRYNDAGVYQRSTDGGLNWVDAPEYDYRNISTIFPPPSALGISNTKCQAADGAVVILNEDVLQGLDNGASVQALLEFVAAVLILFLSAGTLATVSIALFSMAAAIVGFGVSSTKAAFTSTVLDQLRCTLYCNMATDDSIDAAGIARVLTDINNNYTGIVKTSLYSLISAAGAVGITNMMRSNRGSASADCSGCCPACVDLWSIYNGTENYGNIETPRGSNYFIANLQNAPSTVGAYFLRVKTPTAADCCAVDHVEVLSGTIIGAAYAVCDTPQTGTPTHDPWNTGVPSDPMNMFYLVAPGACRVKVFFS